MLKKSVLRVAAIGGLMLAAAVGPLAGPAAAKEGHKHSQRAAKPLVEQAALDLLKKMSDTLKAAPAIKLSVLDFREVPTSQGQMATLVTSADITAERPNKFAADAVVNGVATKFAYDGKTFSVFDPAKNVYVSAPIASDTFDSFFKALAEARGIQFSVADFLSSDPYAGLTKHLVNAYSLGTSTVDGVTATHLVFSAKGIEWQVWIDPATSLPRLFAATYTDVPREPRFLVSFRSIDLNAKPAADAFTFAPPKDARAIEFLPSGK